MHFKMVKFMLNELYLNKKTKKIITKLNDITI